MPSILPNTLERNTNITQTLLEHKEETIPNLLMTPV